jgi:Flp pilus assembly protein TadD
MNKSSMIFIRKTLTVSLVIAASAALAGCQTTAPGHVDRETKIDAVMAQAAVAAQSHGQTEQNLVILEQLYKRNSSDPQAAMKYAHALRQAGYHNRAALVLGPFARSDKLDNAALAVEYASIQAAMGNYTEAETAARKAVLLSPESGKAYHMLGIALDAQGFHAPAQVAFEKGLDHWEGDPSPILNNIGLNLAAQGFLDDAIQTLRKALATAPNRMEIERNLRIVSALQYQPPVEGTRLVPKPPRKPDNTPAAAVPVMEVEAVEMEEGAVEDMGVEDEAE